MNCPRDADRMQTKVPGLLSSHLTRVLKRTLGLGEHRRSLKQAPSHEMLSASSPQEERAPVVDVQGCVLGVQQGESVTHVSTL